MVKVYVMAFPIQHVLHLVPLRFLVTVVHSHTPLLRRSVRVSLLYLLLDLVSGIATRCRAGEARHNPRVSSADPATEQSAHDRTNAGSYQPVLVFDRFGMGDLLVMAFLARSLDRLGQFLGADDLRAARGREYPISGHSASACCRDSPYHQPDCQRLVHYSISSIAWTGTGAKSSGAGRYFNHAFHKNQLGCVRGEQRIRTWAIPLTRSA
jgi:hypothetical protein